MPRELSSPTADLIEELFAEPVGGPVADGAASIWTDFRRHGGRNRILVHDESLTRGRRGRLVQRLIEIETYRMFALLAFPLARTHGSQASEIDRRLADLTARLRDADGVEVQRRLLDDALSLGAEIERIAAATNYRFSAARAYHELAEQRIEELRERSARDQKPGMQPLGQFLRRRLRPAMRTCESLRDRLETASRHLARAANLLRSRIELDLAEQNRAQLAAMNRHSRIQLRLQRTVEGLSVAAISYYVVGLVGTILEAIPVRFLPVSVTVATGLSGPLVLLLAWILMRRIHKGFIDK